MASTRHRWVEDPVVLRQLAGVEVLIADVLADGESLPPFFSQSTSPRTKRLRPLLLLLAARFGPEIPRTLLLRAAAAVELVHLATLYHDDIVDEAALRRGEATVQAEYGAIVAGLAGTELLYAAAELCVDLPPGLRRSLVRAGEALCHGQTQEVAMQGNFDVTEHERRRVARLKTASLFGLAARLGATLSGATDRVIAQLVRLATRIGVCFQLADDLRDLLGTERSLGRAPGADLRDGVYSLPVIHALSAAPVGSKELANHLKLLLRDHDPSSINRVVDLIFASGGFGRAAAVLDESLHQAELELQILSGAGPEPALRSIAALLSFLADESLVRSHSRSSDGTSARAATQCMTSSS